MNGSQSPNTVNQADETGLYNFCVLNKIYHTVRLDNIPNIMLYRFTTILKYWSGILQKINRISKYEYFNINYNIGLKWYYWSEEYIIVTVFS